MSDRTINPDYARRINRALHFIDQNLDKEVSLDKIAEVAYFSPFHFHRIFTAVMKETPNAYVIRKRIEKTAAVLMRKNNVAITELSHQYGFSGNSSFTRAFKKFYGVSPSKFRQLHPNKLSKISKVESKNGQVMVAFEKYICHSDNHKNLTTMNANIEIREVPSRHFAYVTQVGMNGIEEAFQHVIKWAGPKGLMERPDVKVGRIFHDSLRITSPDKVRMSVGISLNDPIEAEGEIGLTIIEKGKFIVGQFEIVIDQLGETWRNLFVWMTENGYSKGAQDPFELYHNDFNKHPERKCRLDLYIPIE